MSCCPTGFPWSVTLKTSFSVSRSARRARPSLHAWSHGAGGGGVGPLVQPSTNVQPTTVAASTRARTRIIIVTSKSSFDAEARDRDRTDRLCRAALQRAGRRHGLFRERRVHPFGDERDPRGLSERPFLLDAQ